MFPLNLTGKREGKIMATKKNLMHSNAHTKGNYIRKWGGEELW